VAYLRQRIALPLYINSFYLIGGTVASAGLGFLFWILAARSASAADVGVATAALASVNLLIALCELGLATSLIHFAVAERAESVRLLNSLVAAGWLCIGVVAAIFLAGLDWWSPGLMPLRSSWLLAGVFWAYTGFNYILALQDAAMLSRNRAGYVFWRNLACNIPSLLIVLPLLRLVGGYTALFLAYSVPNIVIGSIIGLIILPRQFAGYRFFGRLDWAAIAKIARYGLTNYLGNILWSLPTYVLPVIAVNTLPAEETGYFFINWTIANFILIAPRMISFSLFAEGSQNKKGFRSSALQSLLLIFTLSAPIVLLLWFQGAHILGLFGKGYIRMSLLRVLLLSIVPFSINSVFFVVLRVQRKLKQIILFSALTAAAALIAARLLVAAYGVDGLAIGWLFGHTLSALVVALVAARALLARRSRAGE
jgi:O-antigen/teichoic acid export membrane protein